MRKNIILALLAMLIQTGVSFSQTANIDSLKQLLLTEKQDSSRVLLLNKLSKAYLYSRPDSAMKLAQQGVSLARKIDFVKGEATCLYRIAAVFSITGNYPKALQLGLEALKKAETIQDKELLTRIYENIGVNYGLQGDDRQAVNYELKVLTIDDTLLSQSITQNNFINLGDNYEKLNILDSARIYTNKGYEIAIQAKDTDGTAIALNNFGNIYSKMGENTLAMDNYNLCIPYYQLEDDEDGLCEAYLGMAKLFQKAGKNDSCLFYAKLSLAYGQKEDFTFRVMNSSNFLTAYYTSTHNIDSAFVYQSTTIAAKDSLFSQEKQREIQNLSFDESMRQQELALTKAANEQERKNNIQFAIIALAIVCFIIIFLLLSRTIIVTERWIRFLGVLGLLLLFEFINLYIHPYISKVTNDSPLYTLLIMVAIASLLIPFHHKIEHWIKEKMVDKNKSIRLAAAKRTVAQLEKEDKNLNGS